MDEGGEGTAAFWHIRQELKRGRESCGETRRISTLAMGSSRAENRAWTLRLSSC